MGLLALAIVLPTAIGYSIVGALRALRWWRERARPRPDEPSVQRLTADLRRLHAELDRVELASGLPAKRLRLAASRAAYLDALALACRRFGVEPPAAVGRAVPQAEIYRVEAALRRRGLDVRDQSTA